MGTSGWVRSRRTTAHEPYDAAGLQRREAKSAVKSIASGRRRAARGAADADPPEAGREQDLAVRRRVHPHLDDRRGRGVRRSARRFSPTAPCVARRPHARVERRAVAGLVGEEVVAEHVARVRVGGPGQPGRGLDGRESVVGADGVDAGHDGPFGGAEPGFASAADGAVNARTVSTTTGQRVFHMGVDAALRRRVWHPCEKRRGPSRGGDPTAWCPAVRPRNPVSAGAWPVGVVVTAERGVASSHRRRARIRATPHPPGNDDQRPRRTNWAFRAAPTHGRAEIAWSAI